MDIRHLRTFAAVAQTLNFRRAAALLHVAQPAISATIADLERQLGVRLFDRSRHAVALTAVGRELLIDGSTLVAGADRLRERARHLAKGEAGRLRIGFLASPTAHVMPQVIRAFREAKPGFHVQLEERSPEQQVEDLLAGRIDLALTRSIPAVHQAALDHTVLEEDRLMLALPARHHLAKSTKVELTDCASEQFIMYHRRGSALLFDAATKLASEAGFAITVMQEVQSMATVLTLVAAELGVSLVPGCVGRLWQPGVQLRATTPRSPVIPLVGSWSRTAAHPAVPIFLASLRRALRSAGAS